MRYSVEKHIGCSLGWLPDTLLGHASAPGHGTESNLTAGLDIHWLSSAGSTASAKAA